MRSPLDVLDILLGAVDAHLLLLSDESLNWREMNMLNKIRTAILIVFAAYIGFIVAGLALNGMVDDTPLIALAKTNLAIAATWTTIQVGAVIALMAVVIGGLPLSIVVIRRALSGSHHGLGLLLVPVLAFLALVAYMVFILAVGTGRIHLPGVVSVVQSGVFPPGNRLLMAGLMVTFILGAIASTLAVWKVISRTDIEQETFRALNREVTVRLFHFAYWPAVVTTLAMFVMLMATVIWGWFVFVVLQGEPLGNLSPWGTSPQAWFTGILLVMTLSTVVAFLGIMRGRAGRIHS